MLHPRAKSHNCVESLKAGGEFTGCFDPRTFTTQCVPDLVCQRGEYFCTCMEEDIDHHDPAGPWKEESFNPLTAILAMAKILFGSVGIGESFCAGWLQCVL